MLKPLSRECSTTGLVLAARRGGLPGARLPRLHSKTVLFLSDFLGRRLTRGQEGKRWGRALEQLAAETVTVVSTARVGQRVFLAFVNGPAQLVSKWTGFTSNERNLGPAADSSKDS